MMLSFLVYESLYCDSISNKGKHGAEQISKYLISDIHTNEHRGVENGFT
jgi:hypothetical protein